MREENMLNYDIALIEIKMTYEYGEKNVQQRTSAYNVLLLYNKKTQMVVTIDLDEIQDDCMREPLWIFDDVEGPYKNIFGAIRDICKSLCKKPGFVKFEKFNINYMSSRLYTEYDCNDSMGSCVLGSIYDDEEYWKDLAKNTNL
jgi:hypothetical protein